MSLALGGAEIALIALSAVVYCVSAICAVARTDMDRDGRGRTCKLLFWDWVNLS